MAIFHREIRHDLIRRIRHTDFTESFTAKSWHVMAIREKSLATVPQRFFSPRNDGSHGDVALRSGTVAQNQ